MKKSERPKLNAGVLQKRYLAGEELFKYEEDYLWTFLRDKADTVFAKYIRFRDRKEDCITRAVHTCSHKIENCCHRIDRAYYSHRRDERCCYGGCVSCNKYHAQAHGSAYEMVMILKYGIEWVREQEFLKHKVPPTIDELFEIIGIFTLAYNNLLKMGKKV